MSKYQPILATLGYIVSPCSTRVLLIHRNAREGDIHLGKYNGLGGKLEPGEDCATGMIRELWEEAQLVPENMTLRGTINWPGFGINGEDWFGFIFRIDKFRGEAPASNVEGTLEWIPIDDLLAGKVPLWEGDRHFLSHVFSERPGQFHGVLPYENGKPKEWSCVWL